MPTVRVIDRDNVERSVEAPNGATLMEPLRDMDDGVAAICGGSLDNHSGSTYT